MQTKHRPQSRTATVAHNVQGRFPGGELSVISEGSYRTSQDGESSIYTSSHAHSRNGTFDEDDSAQSVDHIRGAQLAFSFDQSEGTNFDLTGKSNEEAGIFRNHDDGQNGKLTTASIASNGSQILGFTSGDLDEDDLVDAALATKPKIDGEKPMQILKLPSTRHKSTTASSSKQVQSFKYWMKVIPMWLKFAVVSCLLLVVGAITIGIAAALSDSKSTSSNSQSSFTQTRDDFLTLQKTPSPSLRLSSSPTVAPSTE